MNDFTDNPENDNESETPLPTDRRPLGYWLRAVDGLLTREFATALEAEGISRRDWMLLNLLAGDIDAPEMRERLARKGKRLRGLEERGWVEEHGDGTWSLTDLGRSEKDRIGAIVDGIRSRVVDAVGDAEAYAALTTSLEAIAREFGWDDSAAGRERGFGGFGGFGRRGFPGFGPEFRGHGFGPGWRQGFAGGPRPFGSDIHEGYGHNRHRGFAPGRPGHPAERFDEPMRGYGGEGCRGDHPHADHGHRDHESGHGHHGEHAHHGHHGDRAHGRGGRGAQQAYERGFDAGFARGRESGAA
ncbi:hypothetical protein [Microbacterium sp. B35-30]|uniref:MarR family winged helix-turn-helix transcriptional regulator n=1 Tax=Microbacterium sp. B35-30 TaxID=1962642 RepID=UPI0023BA4A0A|nr:hypothetical protein [Microbacterium sp. B35-30]